MAVINIDDVYILDETGAEVDKVTGLFTKDENTTSGEKAFAQLNIGTAGSNDNLLDNAYFVGGGSQLGDGIFPINQRGQTSYSSYQVTIDRWTLFGGSVVLEADGITVTSSPDFGQVLEPSRLPVGTYTASVKTADGKIGSVTFTTTGSQFYAGGAMGDTGVTLNFIDLWASDKTLFSLQCQGVKIAAAKLEKGTVSTLANDPVPDFGEEQRKCQRYLWVTACEINDIMASGVTFGTNVIFDLITPVQIRGTQANVAIGVTPYIAVDNTLVLCGGSSARANIKGNHIRFQIGATADLGTYKNCNLLIPSVTFLQVENEL